MRYKNKSNNCVRSGGSPFMQSVVRWLDFSGQKRRTSFFVLRLYVLSGIFFMLLLAGCNRDAYVYTSFHEPADKGLRLIYSTDGYSWTALPGILLRPLIGKQKIMRDPSMVKGPDGYFHLVWTAGWQGNEGIGYAKSKDLLHWSQEKLISVMKSEPGTVNVWAPEISYLPAKKTYLIVWASTIPYRFEKGIEDERNNHRLYYVTTADFKTFSKPALYFDPGFSSIDATLVQRGKDDFVLVFKDNTRPVRAIKVAFGSTAFGPFSDVSAAVTPGYSEGPTVLKTGKDYLIYYDWYNHGSFGAVSTRDFRHFKNVTDRIKVPAKHKHGTVVPVSRHFLKSLIREQKHSNPMMGEAD